MQFELPADASAEEVAYIESLVPRIETGLLELWDPATHEVGIQLPALAHWRVAAKDGDPQRGDAEALNVLIAEGPILICARLTSSHENG